MYIYFRWCEFVVASLVGATYFVVMAALRRLRQLTRPRSSSLGAVTSSSFELVVHGSSREMSHQRSVDFSGVPESTEPMYEDIEDQNLCVGLEDEDEGIWLEGDAGFAWGDTRLERWRWEEEHGEGDYREEDDDVEDLFEFQYGDEEEDWG